MLKKEMEERKALYETPFRALSEKSGDCRKAAAELENESRSCRQVKREEVAVRRNPMDAALIQPHGSKSSHLERHGQQVLSNSCGKSTDFRLYGAGGEEREDWEGDGDDEKAPNEWYESAAVDPVVGGSGGGGNPSTPRNGTHARDSSRSTRAKQGKMEGWRAGEHWQKEKKSKQPG